MTNQFENMNRYELAQEVEALCGNNSREFLMETTSNDIRELCDLNNSEYGFNAEEIEYLATKGVAAMISVFEDEIEAEQSEDQD